MERYGNWIKDGVVFLAITMLFAGMIAGILNNSKNSSAPLTVAIATNTPTVFVPTFTPTKTISQVLSNMVFTPIPTRTFTPPTTRTFTPIPTPTRKVLPTITSTEIPSIPADIANGGDVKAHDAAGYQCHNAERKAINTFNIHIEPGGALTGLITKPGVVYCISGFDASRYEPDGKLWQELLWPTSDLERGYVRYQTDDGVKSFDWPSIESSGT